MVKGRFLSHVWDLCIAFFWWLGVRLDAEEEITKKKTMKIWRWLRSRDVYYFRSCSCGVSSHMYRGWDVHAKRADVRPLLRGLPRLDLSDMVGTDSLDVGDYWDDFLAASLLGKQVWRNFFVRMMPQIYWHELRFGVWSHKFLAFGCMEATGYLRLNLFWFVRNWSRSGQGGVARRRWWV